jgi:copper chaperone CopZ
MKNSILLAVVLSSTFLMESCAQIKNPVTETVNIRGNCGMCETTIEEAGTEKKVSEVDWNEETKKASITFDSKKTNKDEVLKKIALAGYDSDFFRAPDEVYSQLPKCCQYQRDVKVNAKNDSIPSTNINTEHQHEHATNENQQEVNQLKTVFDKYFELKDALVKTDGNLASAKAKELVESIKAVKMEKLATDEHAVWMKVMKDLSFDAEHIAGTKDSEHQRDHFMALSKNMHELMKASKMEMPVYYMFCPMADNGNGANWLSKEKEIKNPYFGAKMMSCGKVVEELK